MFINNIIKYSILSAVVIPLWFVIWQSPSIGISTDTVVKWNVFSPDDTITTGDTTETDSIIDLPYSFEDPSGFPFSNSLLSSPLYLNTPSNITSSVEYDAETNQYVFSEKIGELNYRTPHSMTLDEYKNYDFESSVRNYWRQRARSESFEHQSSFHPKLHIESEVFDRIFGSNTIDIHPQGSAELIFGINISKTENPQLPEKLRKTTTFDFQEKIQMNVTGQIGDKMKLATSYNTEATFEFENKMNLGYEGKEDEIIQKIEAGNVSLPLSGSLITGSQSLFGIKTDLKFGRLLVTSVFSQQKGETSVIEVEGGAQTNTFEVSSDEYESKKHFFVAHYFRENYDYALKTLPVIKSGINITKIEVWITNKTGRFEDCRNIVAFMDIAENQSNIYSTEFTSTILTGGYPKNELNDLYQRMIEDSSLIRDINQVTNHLAGESIIGGVDFEKIESARKLSSTEYTLNARLGYISLNSALYADQVLAVAFEYTVGGEVYRVGEFSNSGVSAPSALIVKLLKGTSFTPKLPTWKLMMKNVYAIGGYQINRDEFYLDVLYQNDETGTAINYLPAGAIKDRILLEVLNLDNLNTQLEPHPDGVFDFVDGYTINASNGRIIFPVLEPFGSYLREQIDDPAIADKYVYEELYDSTQSTARQIAEKNKFLLTGSYQSASGSDISLNAMNIPQGSVIVTAGGIKLVENQDYTVDYTLGRVKIINQGLLESGTPIKISLESQSLFSIQSKTLLGTHLDYRVSNDFNIGGTILHLSERPLTQKVSIGDEPISNTIWGIDGTYRTESPLLTLLVDKLPFIETKEVSTVTFNGEFAHFIPGHSKAIQKSGVSYIDDFEGSKTSLDIKSFGAWRIASTPQHQADLFPEAGIPKKSPV